MKSKKSRKKLLWIIPIIIISLVLVFGIGGWALFGTEFKAMSSIEKLEDGLWSMEYHGDYGFDAFLEKGGAASDEDMAAYISSFLSKGFYKSDTQEPTASFACSAIAAKNENGEFVVGRNFDWDDCRGIVVKAFPNDGYASVSTANLDFLGFDGDYSPDGDIEDKFMTLAAVYVPLDGMNEKGLCVADLAVGDGELGETHQKSDKADLTTVSAIRLLLDHAATVDEAVALLKESDMNSSAGMMHHLALSDATGRSVVVEYIGDKMVVTETPVVTNFYLAPGDSYGLGNDSCMSQERYDMLKQRYTDANGVIDEDDIKSALISVCCGELNRGTTQWSVVYNKSRLTAELWFHEHYENGYSFSLNTF